MFPFFCFIFQGDLFSGLNDGLLSRAEALAAVDMQKHQSSHAAHQQMTQQLKVNKLIRGSFTSAVEVISLEDLKRLIF